MTDTVHVLCGFFRLVRWNALWNYCKQLWFRDLSFVVHSELSGIGLILLERAQYVVFRTLLLSRHCAFSKFSELHEIPISSNIAIIIAGRHLVILVMFLRIFLCVVFINFCKWSVSSFQCVWLVAPKHTGWNRSMQAEFSGGGTEVAEMRVTAMCRTWYWL